MERIELLQTLNQTLLYELPQYQKEAKRFAPDSAGQRRLLRSLMNVRPPMPLDSAFLALQDELLCAEREERGIVDVHALPATADPRIVLWRGDITRLNADVIVNAANSGLLGCFCPCHGCIDNAIHSAAGVQLREECHQIMARQGHDEPTGMAKLTAAYNLPSKWIVHTVGPIVQGRLQGSHRRQLACCYRACLALAEEQNAKSIAFCCISTGEFRFPADEAASIAVESVRSHLNTTQKEIKVIFNVFTESDEQIYRRLLRPD